MRWGLLRRAPIPGMDGTAETLHWTPATNTTLDVNTLELKFFKTGRIHTQAPGPAFLLGWVPSTLPVQSWWAPHLPADPVFGEWLGPIHSPHPSQRPGPPVRHLTPAALDPTPASGMGTEGEPLVETVVSRQGTFRASIVIPGEQRTVCHPVHGANA